MNMRTFQRLAAIAIAAATVFVGAPLAGWPAVVRLPAILVPALLLAALVIRPWRASPAQWEAAARWMPSPRTVWIGALTVAAALFWIVLTRFQSAEINAVDFTVYFDRPCFQTVQGRPLFVETADVARFYGKARSSITRTGGCSLPAPRTPSTQPRCGSSRCPRPLSRSAPCTSCGSWVI